MAFRHAMIFTCVFAFVSTTLLAPCDLIAQVELFVAPGGDDANPGTEAEPLATLEGARQRVVSIRSSEDYRPQPITAIVQNGLYLLTQPLAFSDVDSGSAEHPVTFRAADSSQVVLRGGVTIDRFYSVASEVCEHPFPNKANVWRIDLTGMDLPALDEGIHSSRTRTLHREMESESIHLVVNERLQTLARWPNTGWANAGGIGSDGSSWTAVTTELGNSNSPNGSCAWAHGFWQNDWEDACHPIEFTIAGPNTHFRFRDTTDSTVKSGARFRIENVATQLDSDGEWFWDAGAKQAYVYHEQTAPRSAFIPQLTCPVSFYGVSHFNFLGFTIEGASNCGVEIAGGERVALHDCEIRNVGNTCVHIYHGTSHTVKNCELHDAGAGGVRVEAGDRQTLTPANHRVAANQIHHYSHCHLAYRPAVNAIGVGITIEGNTIHDGPHAAIILEGNDHLVADNEISRVCLETDDVGAIYIGGNPTFRGNRIVGNHVHQLGEAGRTGVVGIYLDDFTSGTTVSENVLQAMPRGIVIGGGRDNLVNNNIILDCLAGIQADARGTTWAAEFVAQPDSAYELLCREVGSNEAFAASYPKLATLLSDSPELPKGNRIVGNWIDSPVSIDLQGLNTKQLVTTEHNVQNARRYLVERGSGVFDLNPSGEALLASEDSAAISKSRYIRRIEVSAEASPSDRAPTLDIK